MIWFERPEIFLESVNVQRKILSEDNSVFLVYFLETVLKTIVWWQDKVP